MQNYVIIVSPGPDPNLEEATAWEVSTAVRNKASTGGPLVFPHNISGLRLFAMLSGLPSNWAHPYRGEETESCKGIVRKQELLSYGF